MEKQIKFEEVAVGQTLKAQGRRNSTSRWLFTFNSNIRAAKATLEQLEAVRKGLREGVEAAFSQQQIIAAIQIKKECIALGHAINGEWIKGIKCVPELEETGARGQLHAHVYVEIKHQTKIAMDYKALKKIVKQHVRASTGEPKRKIYFNAKIIRTPAANVILERYVKKGLEGVPQDNSAEKI